MALCRAAEPGGVSAGAPDRPSVAALLEALAVRRHARRGLAAGAAVATLVFGLFAYLPGTEESLVYWAGLSVVLAAGVADLVTTVLVARDLRRPERSTTSSRGGGRRRRGRCFWGSAAGSLSRWRRRSSWTVPAPASGWRSRW